RWTWSESLPGTTVGSTGATRRCSDEPQRSIRARLPHAVRDLHAGTDPGRLLRRLHAGRLPVLPDRPLVVALVPGHRALSRVRLGVLAQRLARRALLGDRRRGLGAGGAR